MDVVVPRNLEALHDFGRGRADNKENFDVRKSSSNLEDLIEDRSNSSNFYKAFSPFKTLHSARNLSPNSKKLFSFI